MNAPSPNWRPAGFSNSSSRASSSPPHSTRSEGLTAPLAPRAREAAPCRLKRVRPASSEPAAGEKGIDDALFLGFYLVRAVELIVSARGFSRCTGHKDAPRFACAFNA